MSRASTLALAGALVIGATSLAAAQNYTPPLGLPPGAYNPPIDNPYLYPDYGYAPRYAGRSAYQYQYRDPRFVQPYAGDEWDEN